MMLITIATIYISFSIIASILLLASVMLSSKISRQEQLVKTAIIVRKSPPSFTAPYSLKE